MIHPRSMATLFLALALAVAGGPLAAQETVPATPPAHSAAKADAIAGPAGAAANPLGPPRAVLAAGRVRDAGPALAALAQLASADPDAPFQIVAGTHADGRIEARLLVAADGRWSVAVVDPGAVILPQLATGRGGAGGKGLAVLGSGGGDGGVIHGNATASSGGGGGFVIRGPALAGGPTVADVVPPAGHGGGGIIGSPGGHGGIIPAPDGAATAGPPGGPSAGLGVKPAPGPGAGPLGPGTSPVPGNQGGGSYGGPGDVVPPIGAGRTGQPPSGFSPPPPLQQCDYVSPLFGGCTVRVEVIAKVEWGIDGPCGDFVDQVIVKVTLLCPPPVVTWSGTFTLCSWDTACLMVTPLGKCITPTMGQSWGDYCEAPSCLAIDVF